MATPEPILAPDGSLLMFRVDGIDQRCRAGIGTIAALGGVSPNRETLRALLWQVKFDPCWDDMWEADRTCVALFEQLTGVYDEYACYRLMSDGAPQLGWQTPIAEMDLWGTLDVL